MIYVKVPATSANMGSGFDTLGMGISLYSTIGVSETECGLKIIDKNKNNHIPQDERNLIYRAVRAVFDKVDYKPTGLKIIQDSEIPMTRGLGSSSACIIGGMLAANIISGRKLSYSEILDLAGEMEGHPDNVAAAMYGGLCASVVEDGHVYTKSIKLNPNLRTAVFIPSYYVSTKKSRGSVPNMYSREDTVSGISHASLMLAALSTGDMDLLKVALNDKIHQPYRVNDIEGFDFIYNMAYDLGAKGVYLSGSGPSVVAILDGNYTEFKLKARQHILKSGYNIKCRVLGIDNVGAVVRVPNEN